ncbi:ANTAR domain-containing protein [Jiangella asiatica]|uniref:ANTAR domain-containing protein n=2 Tax=Jiangella asiatica TaxID=2530372 RepID=A0A4R5CS83_9ACTN|nr:ANTAR domain-containing protein [Jiangella asiatica]
MLAPRVVDLLGITACGVALVDHHGTLSVVAASSEKTRLLELFQIQSSEGPSLDCYRTGLPVHEPDLPSAVERWPNFAPAARDAGFSAVHALPLRLRDTVIGTMNLFGSAADALEGEAVALAQAFADVATIGILHERTVREYELVAEQLQSALNSRILIEQAKGVLAERLSLSVDEAFAWLRDNARRHNRKLHDVAAAVVDGSVDLDGKIR